MKLNQISDQSGARRLPKRVGRGTGSGRGTTCGRGNKGQKSRSGTALGGFEGGQMPINRRLPKRGFNNIFRKQYAVLNLGRLQKAIDNKKLDASQPIDTKALVRSGLVTRPGDGIRLLADGAVTTAITLHVAGASAKAKQAIEAKGGSLVLSQPPKIKAKPEAKPQAKPQQESQAEAKTESKPDSKPEAKPESPPESKSDSQPEAKAESQPEAKQAPPAESNPASSPGDKT